MHWINQSFDSVRTILLVSHGWSQHPTLLALNDRLVWVKINAIVYFEHANTSEIGSRSSVNEPESYL